MKTNRFLLAAGIMLATTFTLSCSSDDGGEIPPPPSGSINPSELQNQQVYLVSRDADGNRVATPIGNGDYDGNLVLDIYWVPASIPVGKITNGKLSFDSLPDMKSNSYKQYLRNFSRICDDDPDCTGTLNYPSGLSYLNGEFDVNIPGKECYIELYPVKSGERTGSANFTYYSQSGSVTGSATYNDNEDTWTETWEANFSEGWNILYWDNKNKKTTDKHPGGDNQWWLECSGNNNVPNPGGDQSMACYFEFGQINLCMEFPQDITPERCQQVSNSFLDGTPGTPIASCPPNGVNCPQQGIPVYIYDVPAGFTCDGLN